MQVEPKNVMLVHGERKKMELLKARVETEIGMPTHTHTHTHSTD